MPSQIPVAIEFEVFVFGLREALSWEVEMYRVSKLRIRASLLLRSRSPKLLLDLQNEREEERGSTFKRPTLPRNEPLLALH